jgi:hypothetical protein
MKKTLQLAIKWDAAIKQPIFDPNIIFDEAILHASKTESALEVLKESHASLLIFVKAYKETLLDKIEVPMAAKTQVEQLINIAINANHLAVETTSS